jgi:integrase
MPKTMPEPLEKEEMDRLLLASSNNLYYNTLFQLAKNTGRRLGEFYGVEIKEKVGEKIIGKKKVWTEDKVQIEVDKKRDVMKYTGKFNYGLKVKDIIYQNDGTAIMRTWILKRRNYIQDESHLSQELTTIVKTFIRKNNLQLEDFMFRSKTYRAIQNAITQYGKKAGITKKVTMHSFRHYFITHLLKKGWTYPQVAKITGHKSTNSISSYDHVLSSDLKNKLESDMEGS